MSDKLERDILRGERAKLILNDELIKEATSHIDAELWRLFKSTTPNDTETLAYIRQMQYMHAKYFDFLAHVVTDGKVAQINLEAKKQSIKDRMKSWVA